ncbi:hypothetical protein [Paractinoplanes rishiriensis]|uniref:hypothetical protein n=1 Tax=Paractinoplanes rishiriensis TaxID=1050105 RepID=UPI001942B8C2|nr:hypothetical protein [Actinoplanes rishiriensis]
MPDNEPPLRLPPTADTPRSDLDSVIDALYDLLSSQGELLQQLRVLGAVADRVATALLAQHDQLGAAIAGCHHHLTDHAVRASHSPDWR